MSDREKCFSFLENNHKKHSDCFCKNTSCDKCFIFCDARNSVKVCENKKKYILENDIKSNIAVFCVDGGMIDDITKIKCDNLMLDLDDKNAIFIELKGVDLAHAFKQILSAIEELKYDIKKYTIFARIVTSNRTNVPNLKTHPDYIKLRKIVYDVKIHSMCLEDKLSNLI